MATTKKPWTRHKIKDSALKQLAAAANRPTGSLYPGIGYGAPSSRAALIARGLAVDVKIESDGRGPYSSGNVWDCRITEEGRQALEEARAAGW
jgi:hypothetical protein